MGRVGFHMRMDQNLHASVMDMASELNMSMNEFINTVLEDFVAMDEMFIVRLKVIRLADEIIGYEFRVPKELHALQDG
jgi:hypothetical protein